MRLTKHTTTSITAARPSMYTPIGKEPPSPRSIQFTANSMGTPLLATVANAKPEKTREVATPKVAIYWAPSLIERQNDKDQRREDRDGRNDELLSYGLLSQSALPLHEVDFVHVHRFTRAIHRQHHREADRDLCGGHGDHQDRVAYPHPTCTRQVIRERHEREVNRV